MNDLIGTLAFVSVFHLIGGIALGTTVRGWLHHGFSCRDVFLIVWGAIFGGLPLLLGFSLFSAHGALILFAVEIAILVGAIAITILIPDWFLQAYSGTRLMPLAMGGLFFLIGIGVGIAMLRSEPLMALLFFGAFSGAGGLLMITSLHAILKP